MTPAQQLLDPAILTLIVITLGYISACAVWPFSACRRCHGRGRFRSPTGRAWRHCGRCEGTGARIRTGRRVWNHLRRLHRDSTR